MPYYNTQWHKITYINTKYLTKKKPFFKAFKHFFLYSTVKLPVQCRIFFQSNPSFRGVVAYLCFGGIASEKISYKKLLT